MLNRGGKNNLGSCFSKALKLIDSRWGIILFVGVSTYNIVILKSGFEQTPVDLEDAAKIDGANDLVIFFRVMLPLQGPLLATFTLFTGATVTVTYSGYSGQTEPNTYTLSGTATLSGGSASNYGITCKTGKVVIEGVTFEPEF